MPIYIILGAGFARECPGNGLMLKNNKIDKKPLKSRPHSAKDFTPSQRANGGSPPPPPFPSFPREVH